MKDPGLLIVVSGPSGAGKGTICDALRKRFPNINYSISMTTRSPRPGEQDGINYFFSDNAHFEELLAQDAFLEHAKVYDHYYGTPKDYIFRMLNEGKHVMLEIDIQGAMHQMVVVGVGAEALEIHHLGPDGHVLAEQLHGGSPLQMPGIHVGRQHLAAVRRGKQGVPAQGVQLRLVKGDGGHAR